MRAWWNASFTTGLNPISKNMIRLYFTAAQRPLYFKDGQASHGRSMPRPAHSPQTSGLLRPKPEAGAIKTDGPTLRRCSWHNAWCCRSHRSLPKSSPHRLPFLRNCTPDLWHSTLLRTMEIRHYPKGSCGEKEGPGNFPELVLSERPDNRTCGLRVVVCNRLWNTGQALCSLCPTSHTPPQMPLETSNSACR